MPSDLIMQIAGLGALIAALGAGYWRWIRPSKVGAELSSAPTRDILSLAQRWLILLALCDSLLAAPFWWADQSFSFAWDLPASASRMLAMAGLALAAMCLYTLERPTRSRMRLIMILLAVYAAPLGAALLIAHRNQLNFASPMTLALLILLGVYAIGGGWLAWRPPADPPETEEDVQPVRHSYNAWLFATSLFCLMWGGWLYATDAGPLDAIWLWPGYPMSTRLMGVMMLALSAGSALGWRSLLAARVILLGMTLYGIGVALSFLPDFLGGNFNLVTITSNFAGLGLGSAFTLLTERWGDAPPPVVLGLPTEKISLFGKKRPPR
jgi:hypothetical protein